MDGDDKPEDEEELIEKYFDYVLERHEILEIPSASVNSASSSR